MADSTLHNRAILVSLRISSWSAKKFDKQATEAAVNAFHSTSEAGRFNKSLLPGDTFEVAAPVTAKAKKMHAQAAATVTKTNSYKELMKHIAAMRVWYYEQTLAWSDDGWRLLPIRNYQQFTDGIRAGQHKFDRLLAEFIADYPHLLALAKKILNGLFREGDYPTNMRDRFSYGCEYNPVPQGGDFRVALTASEIAAIAASTENRVKQAADEAQGDAVKRLYTCLARIKDRLTATDGNRKTGMATFRDSLIENARDLCDVLQRLNLNDDPMLEQYRRETELLAVSEPETLRDCPDVRIETANRAQSILDAMTATYGKNLFGGK